MRGEIEVDSFVSESSLSNVESIRAERKKMKKQRKHQATENGGNGELKEKKTSLGTDSNLECKLSVSLYSRFREGENSSREEAQLETEQLTRSRRKKRNKEEKNCLIHESNVNVSLESGSKEEANSLVRDSHVDTVENVGFESGLNEQPVHSKRKRKNKRKREMAVELSDGKENSLIHEKQSDPDMEPKVNVRLESGSKAGASSLMDDTILERGSHVETLENISLGSGLKGIQLNEQPANWKRRRKRKRECKMAEAEQFEKLDVESVLKLRCRKENSLADETPSNHVQSKMNVSLESGLVEGANSDVGNLDNISLEYRLKGTQLTEQMVQTERRRRRNRDRRKRRRENRKKRRLSVFEDNDISSERNDRDNNVAGNNNTCSEPQITNGMEDHMSVSENVESKNTKKNPIPDKQSDSSETASTSMVKSQDLLVDGDLGIPEVKDNKTFQIEKMVKTYSRKGRKSSGFESVQENGMIQTSINHLEEQHTTGFSENRPDGVVLGDHAIPAQVLEEAFGNCTGSEVTLNRRKKKKRKKSKESLCKYPDQKDVEIVTNVEELIHSQSNLAVSKDDVSLKATVKEDNVSQTLYASLERICFNPPDKKLLVLDLNGILVDVVQHPCEFKPDMNVSGKGVFKRPFCDDFLKFCFSTFNVGIWSSRMSKNVDRLVAFLMREWRHNLLFCWHRDHCTITKYKTIEDKRKPLVLKELRKLWEKYLPNGKYDESNTLLLDDSPYKALRNPANTAVFPYPYDYRDAKDSALADGGDIRKYLEGLAAAENVQKYVEQNPFGQPAITESNPHWDFYCKMIGNKT